MREKLESELNEVVSTLKLIVTYSQCWRRFDCRNQVRKAAMIGLFWLPYNFSGITSLNTS